MRDKNLNYIQFCKQVESFVNEKLTQPRLLRTTVINSPTFPDSLYIKYPRKYSEVLSLIIVHWWLPDSLKWQVHLDIWSMSMSQFNKKQKLEIKLMIQSKEMTLKYLYLTERYTSHEIFGNLLMKGIQISGNLTILPKSTKVKKPIRKRGYDDKGSLQPLDKWLPKYDYSLTNEQNELEKKSTQQDKLINRLTKHIENALID